MKGKMERLATHYTYTVEKCTLLLENVISDYRNFFKTKGLPIHTARVELTSLISTLFHVPLNSGSDFSTSEKYMYFQNVTPIPDSPSSSLQLPTGCRLTTTPDKEIQIMCPFYPSGGKQSSSYCTIALHWPNTILSFNNFTVSFDIQLRLQSDKIHGLISFVRQLRMCQGVKIVNAGGVKKIEHSEKCKRILLPLSGETCCESCVGLRALRERIIIGIGPGVITRQMLSLEHTHLAEKTCIPKKNKSKRTEIDFSTHGELHVLEQAAMSNRDSQHDLESADDSLGKCNIKLEVPEIFNEKRGADMPMTADNSDFSELDGIFMTDESNTQVTSENKFVTNVFADDNKCKNHGQKNVDTLFKGCSEHADKNRIAMEEERIEETMTDSDCRSGEDADTNINNDIDEFETLKPGSDLLLLQSSTHSPEILKTLLRMQRENKHCDFKLVTPYKTINVHKLIILANSPSFIQNHGNLDNIEELHFPEVLPTVLDSVVYFLYTGKLKVKKSEISLLKSFCVTEGLKSALELLKDYSDVETLSLTVEQLMELPIPQSKDITEEEPANMFVQTNKEKSENAVDIVEQLASETEEKCSVVTKSGRVSKPTSLKIATVMADKKKTKMKSLMSEIKSKERILNIRKSKKFRSKGPDLKSNSKDQMQRKQKSKHFRSKGTNLKRKAKEQMLKLQKSKNFRSKGVEIKRKVLSRHSVYIRQNRKIHRRINNNNVTDILNIYSDFTESQNSSEPKSMAVNEEFDPYHFHNYALSNNDNSNAAASAADDNGDNDDIANNVQYETEINGENKLNGDKSSNKKKVKQQIKRKTKRYPCPDCDKVLSCKRLLQKHMAEVHQDIVQYETEIDGENKLNGDKSSKEKKVKQQIKRKTKRYPCPDCDKVLSCKRLLQKHMAEVHQDKESIEAYKNLACELCGNIETTYKMLARHVINQHGNRDPKNICLVKKETCRSCGLVLRTITGRIRHEIRHHGMQNKSQLTVSFQCTQCEKTFASYLNLKFHEFHLHGSVPERVTLSHCKVEGCNYVGRDSFNLEGHMHTRHSNAFSYPCEFCGIQFKTIHTVAKHVKKAHACRVCKKKIGTKQEMKSHMVLEHSTDEVRPLQCDVCLQRFVQKSKLYMHLYNRHDQPLPKGFLWHHCDKCRFVTDNKYNFERHRHRHEGAAVYTCISCQVEFSSLAGLTKHNVRIHKEVSGSQPGEAKSNLCHICSKKFRVQKQLHLHLYKQHGQQLPKEYTWHKCDRCSFVSDNKVHLKAHSKKPHTGSVAHTCSVCKKAFISNAALKRHLQKHKGAICPQRDCPVICESEAELETHMQQEHEGEKAAQRKERRVRHKKKAFQKSKPESQEESAESGSEIDATVEFHETDDDDDQRRSKMSGTLELITDILAPNTTSTVT